MAIMITLESNHLKESLSKFHTHLDSSIMDHREIRGKKVAIQMIFIILMEVKVVRLILNKVKITLIMVVKENIMKGIMVAEWIRECLANSIIRVIIIKVVVEEEEVIAMVVIVAVITWAVALIPIKTIEEEVASFVVEVIEDTITTMVQEIRIILFAEMTIKNNISKK